MRDGADPRASTIDAVLRSLDALAPMLERLRDDDIRVEGAVRIGRWIVGASGAQAWYDHAIATSASALFDAATEQAEKVAS